MASHFTLGIEEEFQTVDKHTAQLASHIDTIIAKGKPFLGEKIKPEMLQPTLELITDVYPDIATMRRELTKLVTTVAQVVDAEELALISAGTHPSAHWSQQPRTRNPRYDELDEEYQDVGRSVLIFALHVHVGIDEHEHAIPLMNQLRTWIPHFLALSSNSPFWCGRYTGLKSYRSIVWRRFPRSGLPGTFASTAEFDAYVQRLIDTKCIDNGKRIWWDIRPHAFFDTLELRVCDMPATLEDTLAIAALWQALIAKLTWMYKRNLLTPTLPSYFIEENKWLASRYGLDATITDFVQSRHITMRASISELLDFIDDVANDLGSKREITYLRNLLEDSRGTGADRQIALYQETGSQHAVAHFLMQQTLQNVVPAPNLTR